MSRIELIRNEIMKKSNYRISSHHTAGSVFAALYLPIITKIETVIVADDEENKTPKSQLKRETHHRNYLVELFIIVQTE